MTRSFDVVSVTPNLRKDSAICGYGNIDLGKQEKQQPQRVVMALGKYNLTLLFGLNEKTISE